MTKLLSNESDLKKQRASMILPYVIQSSSGGKSQLRVTNHCTQEKRSQVKKLFSKQEGETKPQVEKEYQHR
jgi:hypothetical protein